MQEPFRGWIPVRAAVDDDRSGQERYVIPVIASHGGETHKARRNRAGWKKHGEKYHPSLAFDVAYVARRSAARRGVRGSVGIPKEVPQGATQFRGWPRTITGPRAVHPGRGGEFSKAISPAKTFGDLETGKSSTRRNRSSSAAGRRSRGALKILEKAKVGISDQSNSAKARPFGAQEHETFAEKSPTPLPSIFAALQRIPASMSNHRRRNSIERTHYRQ